MKKKNATSQQTCDHKEYQLANSTKNKTEREKGQIARHSNNHMRKNWLKPRYLSINEETSSLGAEAAKNALMLSLLLLRK